MRKQKKRGTIRAKLKRGDDVVFIAGKEFNRYEKGEDGKPVRVPYRGRVIDVDPRTLKVKVEGAMMVTKHQKPMPQMNIEGGIKRREAWVDFSNVSHVDPDSGKPTRIKYEIRDGAKVRVAKSGAVLPEPAKYVKVDKTAEPEAESVQEPKETIEETAEDSATEETKE